jgi:hypothetical protein
LLQERERQRAQVRAALAQPERQHDKRGDAEDALAMVREALTDWQGMLRQEAPHGRQALSALLIGRLVFTPPWRRPGPLLRIRRSRIARQGYRGLDAPN